ncbi:MAG: cell division protein FtsZ [Rhodospirillaceae bacterium]|nr:MAG: cell division protein FtsZ [Rhodospirillaceae bacterium]
MVDEYGGADKGYWSYDNSQHNTEGRMGINLGVPRGAMDFQLKPRITVIGIGGAGGNAVNNMIAKNLEGVDFIVANTDAQSLSQSRTDRRIQLGIHTTEGLGAGARPEVGRAAAEEVMETIQGELAGSHMAFITAGMGGGTGTGAAPVVARAAREMGILTVGVVTKPFHFEGIHRMRLAEAGMEELARYVDTLIIIPNQNLFRVANERTTFAQAFNMADDVLYAGVRGVTDLIMMPGLINLDFADIRTVMSEMGKAMMGTGEAEGEKRALDAAEAAISNPLLDDTSMKGARGVLINITGGPDMTLYEVDEAANRIRDEVDPDANIIFGSTFDERLEGKIRVSVVATGIDSEMNAQCRLNGLEEVHSIREQRSAAMPYTVRGALEPAWSTSEAEAMGYVRRDMPAEPEASVVNETRPPEPERPGFERFAALAAERQAERQAAASRQTVGRNEAFIPAPAMDPKDAGGRLRSQPALQPAGRAVLADLPPQEQNIPSQRVPPQGMLPQGAVAQNITSPQMVAATESPPSRRPQTLLEKVAGIGRIRRTVEPPKAESREMSRHPAVDSPSLKVEPEDRPINSIEEDLDIPAFLRRQAN